MIYCIIICLVIKLFYYLCYNHYNKNVINLINNFEKCYFLYYY